MVGKRTMAVVLGRRTVTLFSVLAMMMYATTAAMVDYLPLTLIAACFATLPIAVWSVNGFARSGRPHFGSILMASFFIFAAIGFLLS
ncbi:MAG TPA: hypothetical protein VLU38_05335 [Methanomassiliicoccales archaeon]|nr:hypothetical protein [Methanomassiliicoccales archaeon]